MTWGPGWVQAPLIGAGSNAQLTSVLAPFRTGRIFQRFSSLAVGTVDNIIQLTVPYLLAPGEYYASLLMPLL